MEILEKPSPRVTQLIEYLEILHQGTTTKEVFEGYEATLRSCTPFEVNSALDSVLSKADDIESYTLSVARFIRSCSTGLESQEPVVYPLGSLFYNFDQENKMVGKILLKLQEYSKALGKGDESAFDKLIALVTNFDLLETHYVRLQNELFPLFEQTSGEHSCVKLMWSIQDTALRLKKEVLTSSKEDLSAFWKIFGQFYFNCEILRYREELILLPVAYRAAGSQEETFEVGENLGGFLSKTGMLSNQQLEAIFQVLPVDIAFIGADDRVKYYSDPPHRIFPRSPQIIGRLVSNCHPPKSVDTVEEIVTSFKEGSSDSEEFYLTVQGKFIHIQYYAVRSEEGEYLGTLEVSTDASHVRALEGEKRLL